MDGGACWAAVHGVAKSRTRLSNFTFTFHFHALEKEMATHSSVLAWRIPGTGEPGGLPSMGSHRVGHDWSNLAAAASQFWSTYLKAGFPGCSDGKESACSERGLGSIPGLGRSPEKGMATHSSILACRIPWTEDPSGLQSIRSQMVKHDWATFTFPFHTCKVCWVLYASPAHVVHHTVISFLHPSPLHGFRSMSRNIKWLLKLLLKFIPSFLLIFHCLKLKA